MISVVVVSKSEPEMIGVCLDSVKWADELIFIDWMADEKTIKIARDKGARVIQYTGDSFAQARNNGMKAARGEWVLYIDADERVLKPLRGELIKLTKSNYSAVALSRINIIFGQKVDYGPYKKDWIIRFFKKADFKSWIGRIHEYGRFSGKMGYSKYSLLHLTHRDLDQVVIKSLDWSKIDAQLRLEVDHPKMSTLRFLRILFGELFYQGIIRRGFFGGTVGTVDSVLQAFSLFMSYVRLWQLQMKPLDKTYWQIDKDLLNSDFNYQ